MGDRRPRGLGLSSLAARAWRRRLVPDTQHGAWRGQTPRLRGRPQLGVHAFPASGVVCRLRGSACHVAVWERSQFRLCLPLGAGLASRPAALVPRLYQAYTWLLRGLGGLFRLKLRYKGKSFKWHRKRGALVLRFGHAHLVALRPFPGIRWRRQGRMRALLYGASRTELVTFAQMVCWWRPMNVYHGRGLRLRRQVVLRKAGKVSAYR